MAGKKFIELPRVALSVPEAAKALGISAPKAYELCHKDDFPSFKLGGRVIVPYRELVEWAGMMAATKTSVELGGGENHEDAHCK